MAQLRERIFRFAASRLRREQAEDMAQETMLVLHERYPGVSDPVELLPLAFQILRFKMAAAGRKAARRGEAQAGEQEEARVADPSPDPEQAASQSELESRLSAALPALGERCREIFRLKLLGYGFEEIRRHFGVESINTVYTWDARCRKALLERLGGHWEKGR
jgi:RNA polymerase sigma-70 factor (ECF subfamily)